MKNALLTTLAMLLPAAACAADHPPLALAPFTAVQAQAYQQQWAKHLGKELVHTNSIGMKLTLIPPGEFMMGVSEKETFPQLRHNMLKSTNFLDRVPATSGGLLSEMPAHRVRLTKPFYMGALEVTVGQFRRFADETGYQTDAEKGLVYGQPYQGQEPLHTWRRPRFPDRPADQQQPKENEPVMHVDWNDCMAFCAWLSKKEARDGHEYSLPTSAQWEYACRAGTTTLWYFGDDEAFDKVGQEYEWIAWGGKSPQPVGQRKPNPFGLYDMHGNMMEWMADWLHDLYYLESPLNDPTGPAIMNEEKNQRRMVRGGAFEVGRYWSRSAWYVRIAQGSNQHRHPGFRAAINFKGIDGVAAAPEPNMRIVGAAKPMADPVAVQQAAVTRDRPKELQIKLSDKVRLEFVLVPAGTFLMGSLKGGRYERPVHQVVISKPFYIGKYEVTQGQWDAVMGGEKDRLQRWGKFAPRRATFLGPDKPMLTIWNDWREFVERIRKKAPQHDLCLPTEAQWEYACRAGSAAEFSFGDDPSRLKDYGWVCADDAPRPRDRHWPDMAGGGRKPNSWGIHDMHGSVWEWCADWWDEDYYSHSPRVDPSGPATGTFKVLRGGAIKHYGRYARAAFRLFMLPDVQDMAMDSLTGARLVINLP